MFMNRRIRNPTLAYGVARQNPLDVFLSSEKPEAFNSIVIWGLSRTDTVIIVSSQDNSE